MERRLNDHFIRKWKQYFSDSELPIGYYFSDEVSRQDLQESQNEHRCLIGNLNRVRQGFTYVYDAQTPGCPGGKFQSGFLAQLRPDLPAFLSCGIPGKLEGERYKKNPRLALEFLESSSPLKAQAKYLVFKRWDKFLDAEQPLAVVFFAKPDVLSGLFTLANFDLGAATGVITPMGAGCATILHYPLKESTARQPKCVLGMFDVSARPCIPPDTLTFTIPMTRFEQMIAHMDESFLITESWQSVQKRL